MKEPDPHTLQTIVNALYYGGVPFLFSVAGSVEEFTQMGFPQLNGVKDSIVIQIDPRYSSLQDIHTDPNGFSLNLSFDALYRCTIPWNRVASVVIHHPIDMTPLKGVVTNVEKVVVEEKEEVKSEPEIERKLKESILKKEENVTYVRFGNTA